MQKSKNSSFAHTVYLRFPYNFLEQTFVISINYFKNVDFEMQMQYQLSRVGNRSFNIT
jgi:hypothetical protein